MPELLLAYYDVPLESPLKLSSNGHLDLIIPKTTGGHKPYVIGASLNTQYEAESIHFHWGSAETLGSEHEIDNKRFDIEMHIVHRNMRYPDMNEAKKHPDGLAVLAIMYMFGRPNAITRTVNPKFFRGSGPRLNELFPKLKANNFFTYNGSLTSGNCEESVTWIVFAQELTMTKLLTSIFSSIQDSNGGHLKPNYRQIQPLNNRTVFYRP
ncbi:carbonic anhydrase 6-like [Scaptodrosophila lebanonensis]|uniref:Carbonic anhydrase n=1 Tax=Drosophila lebanonensis TaxID=7225 RepID=A0A6J2TKM5_DROLE|nr:carbonic anhydrase 6-like [Scaptodrosophila lebanonensis]